MITIGIKTTKQNKSLFLVYYIIFILHVNKARSIKGKKSFSVLEFSFGCFLIPLLGYLAGEQSM